MSPTPAIVPSARRAVMPEMKTSRPLAAVAALPRLAQIRLD
jgi:hypothetical protein